MSDFLNNLIGRSYGLQPVAQPRLASRFEPVQGDVLTNQEPAFESQEFLTERNEMQPRASLANAARETNAMQPIKRPQSEGEPQHESSQRAGRAFTKSDADERQQPDEVSFEMKGSSQTDEATTASAPLQTTASLDNQSHALQKRDEMRQTPLSSSLENQEGGHVAAANRESGLETESFALPERHDTNSQAERGLKDSSITSVEQPASSTGQREGELSRRTVTPARITAQSSANEMLEQASLQAVEFHFGDATESVAPTIRVTIGRIDVRAVMPDSKQSPRSAAAAPARKAHSPLSLEEYLKQRNGGER